MLFNGKYYNKPGHLGMTRAQVKEAVAGGAPLIYETPADIQSAILSAMSSAFTTAIAQGNSFTQVSLTYNDTNVALIKEIVDNISAGKNVTVIPTTGTVCKPFAATSASNYYQYALDFIYGYSTYFFRITTEILVDTDLSRALCNLYVTYLNGNIV